MTDTEDIPKYRKAVVSRVLGILCADSVHAARFRRPRARDRPTRRELQAPYDDLPARGD